MAIPLFRPTRSTINIGNIANARSRSLADTVNSFKALAQQGINAGKETTRENTEEYLNEINSVDGLSGLDALVQSGRIGNAQLKNKNVDASAIIAAGRNKRGTLRDDANSKYSFEQNLLKRREAPLQQQASNLLAQAQKSNDFSKFNSFFGEGGDGANLSNRGQLIADGTDTQRATEQFFRDDVDRTQKSDSDSFIKNLISGSGVGLTGKTKSAINSNVKGTVDNINKAFGTEFTAGLNKSGSLDFKGEISQKDFLNTITNRPGTDASKQEIVDKYLDRPIDYFKDLINNSVASTKLDTERDLGSLREQYRNSDIYAEQDTDERAAGNASLDSAISDAFGIRQGDETREFAEISQGLQDTQDFDRNGLETAVSNLEAATDLDLRINQPKDRLKTMQLVSQRIEQLSDGFDNNKTPGNGIYGGKKLISKIDSLISDKFSFKDSKGTSHSVTQDMLSGDMILTVIEQLHERNNFIQNEGIDMGDFKDLLGKYATKQGAFNAANGASLQSARKNLNKFNRESSTNLSTNIEAARNNIIKKRAPHRTAQDDARNFIRLATGG